MKEISKMEQDMVKEIWYWLMLFLKVFSKMDKWLKENIDGMMEENIKAKLKVLKCMAMENFGFLMEDITKVRIHYLLWKVIGLRIKKMVKENFIILMVLFIEENGRIINRMDMENSLIKVERKLMAFGLRGAKLNDSKIYIFII